jgi:hypothetical protein
MKIYIVQEINQYSIYKVADHLLESFRNEKSGKVVIEGKSFSEAITKFDALDRQGMEFNSQIIKYKSILKEKFEEDKLKHKQRL